MRYFLVTGKDGSDVHAKKRRQNARDEHIKNLKSLIAAGKVIFAQALLDKDQKMIGSVITYKTKNKGEVLTLLESEPYIKKLVWQKVEIEEVVIPDFLLK